MTVTSGTPSGTPSIGPAEPIRVLPDGTVKQVNPLTGTQVWTVPGRGNRPLTTAGVSNEPIDRTRDGAHCAFCEHRYRETPPEKSRLVRDGDHWRRLDLVAADQLHETVAAFRRVPNLFEILSLDYWQANHGYQIPADLRARMDAYLADPAGREHAMAIARTKAQAAGLDDAAWGALDEHARRDWMDDFFAGGHDVVIARRHFTAGATTQDQLASSGTLTPAEHAAYLGITIDAMADLYRRYPQARYVAAFQNWLRPAGASFDHLHKQTVAIDEIGAQHLRELERLRRAPDAYNTWLVDYALQHGLVVAENDHAIAIAGIGHRYPTLEIFSTAAANAPWEHTPEQVRGVSDLLHACHAATGAAVPTTEEWSHRPRGVETAMPWRIGLKWRLSTLAGFEGGTKINVNTISPHGLRDRVLPRLAELRETGAIGPMRIGAECSPARGRLRYRNPA